MALLAAEHGNGYSVQVLDRVFRILDVLADRPARAAEIAARVGLHRSTVFRLLANLEQHGYVRKDEATGTYSLGLKLFQLGTKALQEEFPVHRFQSLLDNLAATTGRTVQLWIRSGNEAVCVDQAEPQHEVRAIGRVGRRLPLTAGAVGKVLLAYAPPHVIGEYLSEPPAGISSRAAPNVTALRQQLEQIRRQGWALHAGEIPNSWALAAPVFNALGAAEAAVCILAIGSRPGKTQLEQLRVAIVEAADRLSRALGFTGAFDAALHV